MSDPMDRLLAALDQRIASETAKEEEVPAWFFAGPIPYAPISEELAWNLSEHFNRPNRRIIFNDTRQARFFAFGEHATSIAEECNMRAGFGQYRDTMNIAPMVELSEGERDEVIRMMTDKGFEVVTVEVIDE